MYIYIIYIERDIYIAIYVYSYITIFVVIDISKALYKQ